MRIAVVDDERPARSELIYLLHLADESLEILEAESGERMLELLKEGRVDACFVDIDLRGMNGTTLASMIRRQQPGVKIVFATAYRDYAVNAFDLGAVDYILKPFDISRVETALKRLKESVDRPKTRPRTGEDGLRKIMVQGNGGLQILDVADIVYIDTANRTCRVYTVKDCFTQNESLNYYEKRLAGQNFFRIHKSFLVNLAWVKALVPSYNSGYALVMKHYEDHPLPVGRQQVKELRRMFE